MVPSVSYLGAYALQSFSNASEEQKVRPRPCEHVSYGAIANLTEANTRANPTNSITEMPSQADIPKASVSYCYKACSLGKSPSCAVFKTNVSRLFTFPSHNPNWLSTPEHLASAGFFCTEDPDHLQCFQCGLEIERKNNDANIVAVHDQHRPQCRLSRKSQANNLNAIQEAACGHHQAFHVNTTNFSEHPCRVASFLPMSCPQHLKTISNNLASQGVFWTGRENIVYCFCCKASWSQDPSDDPDAIHRQQQPNCPCLRNND
ncbi:baculoviral IAP repeat-containing protein 3 [Biomphalaria glabrata]|nr:baculoviral IAP repeat-containing protein 3 [Biomphalaria glabrata]